MREGEGEEKGEGEGEGERRECRGRGEMRRGCGEDEGDDEDEDEDARMRTRMRVGRRMRREDTSLLQGGLGLLGELLSLLLLLDRLVGLELLLSPFMKQLALTKAVARQAEGDGVLLLLEPSLGFWRTSVDRGRSEAGEQVRRGRRKNIAMKGMRRRRRSKGIEKKGVEGGRRRTDVKELEAAVLGVEAPNLVADNPGGLMKVRRGREERGADEKDE